jgi:hypothetical protein
MTPLPQTFLTTGRLQALGTASYLGRRTCSDWLKNLSQQPALGGEDTESSKRFTKNAMRELSAHTQYGCSPLSMFCATAHKEECSGRTHHDKDVDRIASLSGMKWILIKYTIFEHSIEKLLKY